MNGYVKLHRKIEKWEWFNEPNTFRLFIYLMLNANHEKGKWRGIEIDRGQLITGRKQLSTKLELTERQIRTCLANLESTNEIAIKTTNRFSLVTITRYDFYQSRESETTNETTNNKSNKRPSKSPTNDHQTTTNKNEKNKEEEKNIYRQFGELIITHEEVDKLLVDYTSEQIDDILDKIQNYKKNKDYTSLYLTAKTWLKKEYKTKQEEFPLTMKEPEMWVKGMTPEDFARRYLNKDDITKDTAHKSENIMYYLWLNKQKISDYWQ